MEKKTSIIIVTYNTLDYVKKCIESVLLHTSKSHEIIIVDNASENPTKNYVQGLGNNENIKIILNNENRLWSPANNQGLKHASADSEFLLLLNSDVEVFKNNWITSLQQPMLKWSNVGITGTQYNFDPVWPTLGAIDGCCFMIRRKLVNEIGLLDERYPWNGAGSVFTYNAWKKGWLYYHIEDQTLLIHYGKRSRYSNNFQLKNQKVPKFEVLRQIGFKPKYAIIPYFKNKLGIFNINDYLNRKIK
ncbi:MAG: glycosyltransferase family 2 protein [Saprospiraceae bacterium]|nr:glycosyltransferase family 2 protein [Saprospiraceae bacterium]